MEVAPLRHTDDKVTTELHNGLKCSLPVSGLGRVWGGGHSLEALGRVSGDDQKRVSYRGTRLQREHIFKNFNCPTRE